MVGTWTEATVRLGFRISEHLVTINQESAVTQLTSLTSGVDRLSSVAQESGKLMRDQHTRSNWDADLQKMARLVM